MVRFWCSDPRSSAQIRDWVYIMGSKTGTLYAGHEEPVNLLRARGNQATQGVAEGELVMLSGGLSACGDSPVPVAQFTKAVKNEETIEVGMHLLVFIRSQTAITAVSTPALAIEHVDR